jgi:Zn-finger nucleic acid-binding protein
MTYRQGIEIDYCPQCRGVWLDRGELDKLIERAVREERDMPPSTRSEAHPASDRSPYERERERYYDEERHRRQRKSWLGEILDFD